MPSVAGRLLANTPTILAVCPRLLKKNWFVRGSSAESRVAYDLVSGAFHAWCLPRLCGSGDVSAESDFELEDTWEDGDDGD